MLKKGLYESVITSELRSKLAKDESLIHKKEEIDSGDSSKIFASYLANVLELGLNYFDSESEKVNKQIELVNNIITELARKLNDEELYQALVAEANLLRALVETEEKELLVPISSLSYTSLFTGSKTEPQIYTELIKEINSADRIDLLISFIRFSGLRLILPHLQKHTEEGKPLRVITTSYMGATDYKAVEALAKLKNTQVKVSYDTKHTRLHAKAYYFHRETGFSTAYIGSANMSYSALTDGLEWNLKISEPTSKKVLEKYRASFETYWNSPDFEEFDPSREYDQKRLRKALTYSSKQPTISSFFDIRPYNYQKQVLDKLAVERELYNSKRNLLVAATGTGKTVIAAFDFKRYYQENPKARLLFLAHREEILTQSIATFRGVLKDNNFADLWVGDFFPSQKRNLFASIQTLTRQAKYMDFAPDYFDFIILDETHHAAAQTYDRLLEYFSPGILLGLTATPERLDGEDITRYFNDRIASEIRLTEAIERGLLSPFHYFGVTDDVDLSDLKWERGGYDISELDSRYLNNKRRINTVIRSLNTYITDLDQVKGLGFCVSQKHAAYMAESFNKHKIKSINLDANSSREERETAQDRLERGEIQFIFVVDLYNEGVDIPGINTILFLRPTQSPTVFIQQLGRGLRITKDKEVLTVLDFVGRANREYNFERKFRSLISKTNNSIVAELEHGFPNLPRGCFIQLERKAEEYILDNLKQTQVTRSRLRKMLRDFKNDSKLELNLVNFLNFYELEPLTIYRTASFYELCDLEGLIEDYRKPSTGVMNTALGWILQIDSKDWIDFLLEFLKKSNYSLAGLTHEEELFLVMFHYSIWNNDAEGDLIKYLNRLRSENPYLLKEIVELLEYNREHIDFLGETIDLDFPFPLELYAKYSIPQVMAALGESTASKRFVLQSGVHFVEGKNTDVFFITLDKSDKSFTPETSYEDYAISEELFHWQSQSRTSVNSSVGKRYIKQGNSKHNVLFFVRERKELVRNKVTSAFHFLGKGHYHSHHGSKPISMEWKMEKPIPAFILEKSNKLAY